MLATNLDNQIDTSKTLNQIDEKLILTLTAFAQTIAKFGYKVSVTSQRSLNKLPSIPDDKKNQIISYFENWMSWLNSEDVIVDPENVEKNCLKKALDFYNLKASEEFWKTVDNNQIVEIYGEDMVQLYRSLNFFNVTGYSLLDISVFEWFVLWQRPTKATELTLGDARTVIESYNPVIPFSLQRQLIREIYQTEMTEEAFVPRAMMGTFLNMGSLLSSNSADPRPKGLVCNSKAELIALGEESENIQFI